MGRRRRKTPFADKCLCCNLESDRCGKNKGPYKPKHSLTRGNVPLKAPWRESLPGRTQQNPRFK